MNGSGFINVSKCSENRAEIRYADIINLPHHVSKKHQPMSISSRAAQFSPFAALTGLDDAIDETAAEHRLFYDRA
jgi:hypothetical protein